MIGSLKFQGDTKTIDIQDVRKQMRSNVARVRDGERE
jgi:hypothetical protein